MVAQIGQLLMASTCQNNTILDQKGERYFFLKKKTFAVFFLEVGGWVGGRSKGGLKISTSFHHLTIKDTPAVKYERRITFLKNKKKNRSNFLFFKEKRSKDILTKRTPFKHFNFLPSFFVCSTF